jgi:hypothetical protein
MHRPWAAPRAAPALPPCLALTAGRALFSPTQHVGVMQMIQKDISHVVSLCHLKSLHTHCCLAPFHGVVLPVLQACGMLVPIGTPAMPCAISTNNSSHQPGVCCVQELQRLE